MATLALSGYSNTVLNVVSALRYFLHRPLGGEDLLARMTTTNNWLEFAIPGIREPPAKKKSEATVASLSPISLIALTRASTEE